MVIKGVLKLLNSSIFSEVENKLIYFDRFFAHKPALQKVTNIFASQKCCKLTYLTSGSFEYTLGEEKLVFSKGQVCFIPPNVNHYYSVYNSNTSSIQIFFYAFEVGTDEPVFKGDRPYIFKKISEDVLEKFSNFYNAYISDNASTIKLNANLFGILEMLIKSETQIKRSKIFPAIDYINKNYNKKIYLAELARICYLSSSQLIRRFKQEVGM